jgi:hypothetical protein
LGCEKEEIMTKHTPAPWRIEWHKTDERGQNMIYADDNIPVAIITVHNRANAQLIASAPELLEACKRIKIFMESTLCDEEDRPVYDMLNQAIKKAEKTA